MTSSLTISAALVTGVVTSVHCMAMCGPLACSVSSQPQSESRQLIASLAYHGGRLISYSSVGALAGALGEQPLRWLFGSSAWLLPWFLILVFLVSAFGLWRKLPRPKWLNRIMARARLRSLQLSSTHGGFALGLATPMLPCGPLYLLFAACLVSGSPLRGAEFAIAFGLGTIPLLWVAQHSLTKLQRKIPAIRFQHLQRGLALIAAIIMIWRLSDTLPTFGSPAVEENVLPTCCH